jgi:hypothetical protein
MTNLKFQDRCSTKIELANHPANPRIGLLSILSGCVAKFKKRHISGSDDFDLVLLIWSKRPALMGKS